MEYFKNNWSWILVTVVFGGLYVITQNTWSKLEWGNPGSPSTSSPLYSRADLSLTPEEETFAGEILAGIPRVQETVPVCAKINPGLIKVSGTRTTETGYVFYVHCTDSTGGKTVYFNKNKIISITLR